MAATMCEMATAFGPALPALRRNTGAAAQTTMMAEGAKAKGGRFPGRYSVEKSERRDLNAMLFFSRQVLFFGCNPTGPGKLRWTKYEFTHIQLGCLYIIVVQEAASS